MNISHKRNTLIWNWKATLIRFSIEFRAEALINTPFSVYAKIEHPQNIDQHKPNDIFVNLNLNLVL